VATQLDAGTTLFKYFTRLKSGDPNWHCNSRRSTRWRSKLEVYVVQPPPFLSICGHPRRAPFNQRVALIPMINHEKSLSVINYQRSFSRLAELAYSLFTICIGWCFATNSNICVMQVWKQNTSNWIWLT
jgi:hypothetical protein